MFKNLLLILLFVLCGCRELHSLQKNYYYEISNSFGNLNVDNDKNNLEEFIYPFYQYNGKLIELILRKKITTTNSLTSKKTIERISYDTIAVQIIDPEKKTFIQIDSFSPNCKVLSKGNYKNSPIGLKLNISNQKQNLEATKYFDTSIHNINYKYQLQEEKDINGLDSIRTLSYSIDDKDLVSIFDLSQIENKKNKLRFAGFSTFVKKDNFIFGFLIRDVRLLKSSEIEVCKIIFQKTL